VLDDEKKQIAWFWDDNPNTSEHRGHLVVMIHKFSPPGHWLNIISQISTQDSSSLFKTTKAYTYSAIAMFDVIISCWDEKYKTNLVRPITYIQENIDIDWKPLIQTPPFPEYTSGHSAISAAAATVLTDIYGDNYAFTDSTEVLFEQPVRSFKSFQDAAWEVSLSRFYAGIHYMNGITEGNKQGKFIGQKVLDKLK
jgi:membrane-associated phospholipid phosphatase